MKMQQKPNTGLTVRQLIAVAAQNVQIPFLFFIYDVWAQDLFTYQQSDLLLIALNLRLFVAIEMEFQKCCL